MTKKISENEEDVIIATESNKKIKTGRKVVDESDESDDDEYEDDESEDDESEDDESEDDEKTPIKESTDHIIGIVSSKKFHLLEDSIMGVVKSKIRERIDEQKAQIKSRLTFKGA